ncbi:MAG: TonB-dependent receptor plug domain-containing protein [Planctomycetota bacterium]|jgi:iron complex outermembrane receptor protein
MHSRTLDKPAWLMLCSILLSGTPINAQETLDTTTARTGNSTATQDLDASQDPTSTQSLDNALAALDLSALQEGSDDELLLFEDIPVVISASRQETPQNLSPVPISILTSADLHFSGVTSVQDLLHMVPGMDLLYPDRNRVALGVRGLHDWSSDRTLTLIDGRNASDVTYGGADFVRIPLFVEDVERVEVVRGPSGGSWGANAFNGVINVIKKRPEDMDKGGLFSTTLNEFGDSWSQLRWVDSDDAWAWRLSVGYETIESSEEAVSGDNFTSNDHRRGIRLDAEATRTHSQTNRTRIGASYSHLDMGDFEILNSQRFTTYELDYARFFIRNEWENDSATSEYIQFYSNLNDGGTPSAGDRFSIENDIEYQRISSSKQNHTIAYGGNLRVTHIDSPAKHPEDFTFRDDPYTDVLTGAFISDRWTIDDRSTLESQMRLDYYTETGVDWSGRVAYLKNIDRQNNTVVRLAAAKSFRTPLRAFTDGMTQRLHLGGGIYAFQLTPADDLSNEEIYALEAGVSTNPTERLQLSANTFYHYYEDLIGSVITNPGPPTIIYEFRNLDSAQATGGELEATYNFDHCQLSAWYAYVDFNANQSAQDTRSFYPARHKVGVTARAELAESITGNLTYRYTDTTPDLTSLGADVPAFHQLDLTLASPVLEGRGEILIGVRDLFDQADVVTFGLGQLAAHETPGRTAFIRFQVNF